MAEEKEPLYNPTSSLSSYLWFSYWPLIASFAALPVFIANYREWTILPTFIEVGLSNQFLLGGLQDFHWSKVAFLSW